MWRRLTTPLYSTWRWLAMASLWANAAIHVDLAPMHLAEAGYIGVLFLALAAGCIVLAVALALADGPLVWLLAGGLSTLALAAFVASRTIGLPMIEDDIGRWADPMGVATMFVEVVTIAASVASLTDATPHPVAERGGKKTLP